MTPAHRTDFRLRTELGGSRSKEKTPCGRLKPRSWTSRRATITTARPGTAPEPTACGEESWLRVSSRGHPAPCSAIRSQALLLPYDHSPSQPRARQQASMARPAQWTAPRVSAGRVTCAAFLAPTGRRFTSRASRCSARTLDRPPRASRTAQTSRRFTCRCAHWARTHIYQPPPTSRSRTCPAFWHP